MDTFKGKAIVLKETYVGESDKIITILMKERGKLSVSAKGARKPKSKFLAGTQLFTYSDFVIKDSGRFLLLSQVDIIESFYNIRNDYDRFCFATYFLELSDKATLENMYGGDENLYLLIKSLQALSKNIIDPVLVSSIFQFKFLQLNGYSPEIHSCSICGAGRLSQELDNHATGAGRSHSELDNHATREMENLDFFGSLGLVCNNCIHKEIKSIRILPATIYSINYILESDIKNLYNFKVSNEVLLQLRAVARLFIDCHLDVNLKSKDFFNEI